MLQRFDLEGILQQQAKKIKGKKEVKNDERGAVMKEIIPTNSEKVIKVDDEDYPLLSRFSWYVSDTGYAMTQLRGIKHLRMHQLVFGKIRPKLIIDHINRDKLDNRKCNLRSVTQKQNMQNTERVENQKGYYFSNAKCRRNRNWVVDFMGVDNTFNTEEEAKRAVEEIKNGTFVKEKDKNHDICSRCGGKKQFYGSAWVCRKCALKRMHEYYVRKKIKEEYA